MLIATIVGNIQYFWIETTSRYHQWILHIIYIVLYNRWPGVYLREGVKNNVHKQWDWHEPLFGKYFCLFYIPVIGYVMLPLGLVLLMLYLCCERKWWQTFIVCNICWASLNVCFVRRVP